MKTTCFSCVSSAAPGRSGRPVWRAACRLACLVLLLAANGALAGPFAKQIPFVQPDGTPIVLSGRGDEFYAVFETLDGYAVVFDPGQKAYCFARQAADGPLVSTGVQVHRGDPVALGLARHERMSDAARQQTATQRRQRWEQGMQIQPRWNERKAALRRHDEQLAAGTAGATDGPQFLPPAFTTTGLKVGLTMLIDFSDAAATVPASNIVAFLNATNYTDYGNNGSVRTYFYDNSGGMLTYTNVVTIYIRAPRPKSYYNDPTKDAGAQANILIKDALDAMKALPNYTTTILPRFAPVTVDTNSNEVIAFNVFYAGDNGGVWAMGLWPHSWSLIDVGAQELSPGGKRVFRYQISDIGNRLAIATFCHENGHMLCDYPDLYDYTYTSIGGAGAFCLMGSGGSGIFESNPAQICAYLKRASGWGKTTELNFNSSLTATLPTAPGTNFNHFYRFQKPGVPTEYYLAENRQKTNHDALLPASGIAIWHADELGNRDNSNTNYNNVHANYEATLMQADNLWDFEFNVNEGDSEDLFYLGNTSAGYTNRFADYTAPSARWWDGSPSGLLFADFSTRAETMTFRVGFGSLLLTVADIFLADGNGNGVVEYNETSQLWLVLRNDGQDTVSNITTTVSTATPEVLLTQGASRYPDAEPGQRITNTTPFVFYTTPNFACGTPIDWRLLLKAARFEGTNLFRLDTGLIGLNSIRFNNNTLAPIPDNSSNGVDSVISVAGLSEPVGRITVSLYLTHTRDDDLTIQLLSPDGTNVTLAANRGGAGQNYGTDCGTLGRTTFDDTTGLPISAGVAPFVGSFRPDQLLSSFRGKSGDTLNGNWRLRVIDNAAGETGVLQCWSLGLNPVLCTDGGGPVGCDLAVQAAAAPEPVGVGVNLTYGISVTNTRPTAATGVWLTNVLPAGVAYLSSTVSQGTVTNWNGTLFFNLGTVTNGAVVQATVVVTPFTPGPLTNTFGVTSAIVDINPTNNLAFVASTVVNPAPYLVAAGAQLLSEGNAPPNHGIDPGETVTVSFGLLNRGSLDTANLVATLQPGNGVTAPGGPQVYGVVPAFGQQSLVRPFAFTAQGAPGSVITATLRLQDDSGDLGFVSFNFTLSGSGAFVSGSSILINDAAPATPYPSILNVSNLVGVIDKVTVKLSKFAHTFPKDVNALLVGPSGSSVMLMSHAGSEYGVTNLILTFDQAAAGLPGNAALASGTYQPTSFPPGAILPAPAPPGGYGASLDLLRGGNPNGAWRLFVQDDAGSDHGVILGGWSLTFNTVSLVNSNADLVVALVGAPDSVVVGTPVTYTATVTNLGRDLASGVVLDNLLPAGMDLLQVTNTQGSITTNGGQLVASLGTLPAGGGAKVTILARPTTVGSKTVSCGAAANELDVNLLNNTASVVTPVAATTADLAVQMTGSPSPAVQGGSLVYTITVTNQGPYPAAGVWVTNTLHPGDLLVSSSPSQGTNALVTGGRVICWLGSLPVAGSAVVIVTATPMTTGAHTAFADVAASTPDPALANNRATAVTTVVTPAPAVVSAGVALLQEFGMANGAIDPGERVTLSLALRNSGTADTSNLRATLQEGTGVILSDGPQVRTYGALAAAGAPVAQPFTFTASSTYGDSIIAVLALQDGSTSLGTVSFSLPLSIVRTVASASGFIISDLAKATLYPATIVVSNVDQILTKVTVTVNGFTHGFPADVKMLLVGPGGQNVELMGAAGGGLSVNGLTLTFDDDAPASLPELASLSSGSFKPTSYDPSAYPSPAPGAPYGSTLTAFSGSVPNGTWSLYVQDTSLGDGGSIAGWALNFITTRPLQGSVDLAVRSSMAPLPVRAGEAVTLTVTAVNYGPADATGVVLTNLLPSSLYVVSAVPSKGGLSRAGNLLTCDVGGLTNGESFVLTVTGNATTEGTLANLAGLGGAEADPNPINNLSSLAVPVSPPMLRVELSGDIAVVSWPRLVAGYVLQTATVLTPTPDWQNDSSQGMIYNDRRYAYFDITESPYLYFRLAQP